MLLQIRLAESKRALAQRLQRAEGNGAGRRDGAHLARHRHGEGDRARRRITAAGSGRMLHSAVGFLALEAMIALYALIVISPFAIVAALVWFWRRRSVDRLLHDLPDLME